MSDAVSPQLLELARTDKPTDYAMGLVGYYEDDVKKALNYEMISAPRGGALSYDSFLAAVKLDVASDPRLQEAMMAAPGSFIKALTLAAQCKLLPGGAYNLFYLIPRWNRKLKCNEVTPLIGYKGLTDMAQRHPRVHKIEAHLVYEGEDFAYNPGLGTLSHAVDLLGDRDASKVVGGYARVVITEPASTHPVLDDPVIHVMNRKEIDAIMHRSDAYKQSAAKGWNNSPWHTDWKPMAKKTLLRAVMNGGAVPRDMGVGGAIQVEDTAQSQVKATTTQSKVSVQQQLREQLEIDAPVAKYDLAEEAVAAISAAKTVADLERLRPGWQHFEGVDAETVATAYDNALEEVSDDA